nr:hypothetical protein [uncultured Cellulosilyticum sp.]
MKLKDNNYGKVEGILYNLPKLKIEIENLKLDLEEVEEIMGIHGQSGNVAAGSSTYAFNSAVENEVIDRDENLEDRKRKIEREIRSKERELRKRENILSTLTDKQMLLVELRYFKQNPVERVCDLLEITSVTFHERKKEIIVEKLMPMFFK